MPIPGTRVIILVACCERIIYFLYRQSHGQNIIRFLCCSLRVYSTANECHFSYVRLNLQVMLLCICALKESPKMPVILDYAVSRTKYFLCETDLAGFQAPPMFTDSIV